MYFNQKMRTSASEESLLSAKCPHWTNFSPSLSADVFYGQPRMKVLYIIAVCTTENSKLLM